MDDKFDVVAVSFASHKVRLIDKDKSAKNAEAIVSMAVMRRGVDEEFFAVAPAGKYAEGDSWDGE